MALPTGRKPRASEVADWSRSRIGKRIDVDGYYGAQCWDLPNYILKRYWGFTTPGNAIAMGWYNYPKGFKKYNNTPSFVPKPGDIAVWGTGSFNNGVGHVAIVVGPSTKSYFTSIDQNWYTANWSGSPAYKIKHTYNGISKFVRPAYYPEKKTTSTSKPSTPTTPKPTQTDPKPEQAPEKKKPAMISKPVTKVKYTSFNEEDTNYEELVHYMNDGSPDRTKPPKGIYVRESSFYRDVRDIYKQRNKYMKPEQFPHAYVDRELAWHCRHTNSMYPENEDYLVLEVCGAETSNKREFLLNQLTAILYGLKLLEWQNVKLTKDALKLSPTIWRSMKDLIGYDMIVEGFPENVKYEDVKKKLLANYLNIKKLMTETITTTTVKTKIKVKNPNANQTTAVAAKPGTKTAKKATATVSKTPKINVETSRYTFSNALTRQMYGRPQISNGWSWYNASRTQTSNAMNPTNIWNSGVQRYQMLNLGKYQGIPVAKLNSILKGKGKLSGQGKAFSDGCKKHNLNEIYLIAHAMLESGNGTSNYASGRYGTYNFFGIGAYDSNPNNSIAFARNRGWTTPAKAIIGGASFVRKDYINQGQNTLYRMRWNPKAPATHQYATDIRWCQHQATTIYNLYKKIGLKGMYYTRDKYR